MQRENELRCRLETEDGAKTMVGNCFADVKTGGDIIIFGAGCGGVALYHLLE